MHTSFRRTATAVLTAGAVALPLAAPAHAAEPDEVASGLGFPLGLSVGPDGRYYVSEAATGELVRLDADGERETLASVQGGVITGIDARRTPQRVYLEQGGFEEQQPYARLKRVDYRGRTSTVADLMSYEVEENPDAGARYGFEGLDEECAKQVPEYAGPGGGYDGIVESNPYAVAIVPGGWAVADAAGNSILSVRRDGTVSTLAVLPSFRQVLTQEQVDALNAETAARNAEDPEGPQMEPLPDCVAGKTYAFEAVPTDVELGRDGNLYVSTLTGGPESPVLGARSRIYKVDRRDAGAITEIGSGFAGAVDLAVGPDLSVYVAELFGGQISEVVDRAPQAVAEVPSPSTVEFAGGELHATIDLFNEAGSRLVTIAP